MSEDPKENDAIKIGVARIAAEKERLETELQEAKDALLEKDKALRRMNEFIELGERAKLREELRQMGCTYGVEEYEKMGLDALEELKNHYKHFKPPFKSSRDVAKPYKSLYDSLYDEYVPVEDRIKKLQEG